MKRLLKEDKYIGFVDQPVPEDAERLKEAVMAIFLQSKGKLALPDSAEDSDLFRPGTLCFKMSLCLAISTTITFLYMSCVITYIAPSLLQ